VAQARGGKAKGRWALVALALVGLTACRQDMQDQPKYKPLAASQFFADGTSARTPVPDTVARGKLNTDTLLDTGKIDGQLADEFPFPVTAAVLDRGQDRFNIYCTPCHGRLGDGDGMVARRGFRKPPSFHEDRLRAAPAGHFFDVMTNGFGVMPDYRAQVPVRDRWAIAAYIRALQLSQHATMDDVPAAERTTLGQSKAGGAGEESHR
jgi:mono/diheme cytochrome c family protein